MSDRTLSKWIEKPNENGYHSVARIERSAAGQPAGLLIIETYHLGHEVSSSCVVIEDLNDFLAPVESWLDGV